MAPEEPLDRVRRARARSLRMRETDPEKRLWRALRAVPPPGSHFRRQVPIGPYVADFGCLAARLLIELDGGHHGEPSRARHNAVRDAWLAAEGYRVLRFWNQEVGDNLAGVLETIYAALHGAPDAEPKRFDHPTPALRADPPPRGEG